MVALLCDPDPPLLDLHALSQSRHFVEFNKLNTYVLNPPTTKIISYPVADAIDGNYRVITLFSPW